MSEEEKIEEKISIKKSTYKKLIYGLIGSAIIISFISGYQVGNFDSSIPTIQASLNSQIQNSQAPSPTNNGLVQVSLDDDPLLGDKNAPITIVEFGDFQCPFCKRFHQQTLPDIKSNYIDKGIVNIVWKDFPIQSIHQNAVASSIAGECADDQGLFWELHDRIFDEQQNWEGLPTSIAINDFKRYASEIGINENEFNKCLDSEKYRQEVLDDFSYGSRIGISGTPAFFVGNQQVGFVQITGAQPYSVFENIIEALLVN